MAVKSHGQWYWSRDLADGLYPATSPDTIDQTNYQQIPPPDFKDGTVVSTWRCRGVGKSIASVRIDVDLFHRFACAMHGAKFKRLGQFTAAINNLKAQVKATPAPVPQAMLDKLAAAYRARAAYQAHGDPVARTIPVFVTGRRAVAFVGVFPV